MSETKPNPTYDPGWNDPPTFQYSNAPPATKTKLNLNKRIAFPIQSSSSLNTVLPKVEKSGAGLPMPFAKVKHDIIESNETPILKSAPPQLPPSSRTELKSTGNDNNENFEKFDQSASSCQKEQLQNSHEFVMKTLCGIIESIVATDNSKIEEINKRLNILSTMWQDGKINDKLKGLLVKTAEALQDNNFSSAIDMHRSIIVDHGSNACGHWGPALRQLILIKENECKKQCESDGDAPVSDEPKLINTLDEDSNASSKSFGRVIHI